MSFDMSRVTFDPWKDFSSVVMQQGRVQLDSDWNEWLAELTRRIRAGTMDIVGRAVYPATTPNAFLITPQGSSIIIGVGRMYVDGLLVENHGLPAPGSGGWIPPNPGPPGSQPAWDPALDELVGQNAVDYEHQPYFPGVAQQAPFPTTGGPFLVYLDVWQREVTFLEAPDLIEKAVGVDTTGRLQTVWQVRLLDVSGSGDVTCGTKDITAWTNLIQPSAGRLTTGIVPSSTSGPCCLAPNTGFTGLENQLYRVEIHQVPPSGSSVPPTFKWSRNNASVATPVTGISQDRTVLTVQSTGRDNVLRFTKDDWVEITDDWLELNGEHGELHQVTLVTDSNNTITLATPVTAGTFPVDANGLTHPERHTRVIKWDQQGKVFESDGTTVWTDLNAPGSTGEIPVPPAGTSLILENGVTVSFDLDPSGGAFQVGDYWNFAARTLDGTVENLVKAPPRGIHHHYARLAMLTLGQKPTDCRIQWPPQEDCACTSCVTAQSHNNNTWTIQQAIDAVVLAGGGKVCLGPGTYNIAATINVVSTNNPVQHLAICGHGLPTLVPIPQFQGQSIMQIQKAIDVDVYDLAFSCGAPLPNPNGVINQPVGLSITDSVYVRVEHCGFGLAGDTTQLSAGITLAGLIINCSFRENLFTNVQLGVAPGSTDSLALLQFDMEHNQMYCTEGAVSLNNVAGLVALEVRFANNFVQSSSGFVLAGFGLDVIVEENTFSLTAVTPADFAPYGAAVACNMSQLRVANNEISRNIVPLSATVSADTNGVLAPGSYIWVVTALETSGQELVITQAAALTVTTSPNPAGTFNATLEWTAVKGVKSYNVYRSTVNTTTLHLVKSVDPSSTLTLSFLDNVPDSQIATKGPFPPIQNDGIVLGSPSIGSFLYGTQVTGNRISTLMGTGILALQNTFLLESAIAQNQLLLLGGNGITLSGFCLDIDIQGNSMVGIGLLPDQQATTVAGLQIFSAINVNISENRMEGIGVTLAPAPAISQLGILIGAAGSVDVKTRLLTQAGLAAGVRIAGNLIAEIAPSTSLSAGVFSMAALRSDVSDNEIRRSVTPPATRDQSISLALQLIGIVVSVQGNLLESFGGNVATAPSGPQTPGTVGILALDSCTFSNNQCFLDNADPSAQVNVVAVGAGGSIIAMGNLVKGPKAQQPDETAAAASLSLAVATANRENPPVTVIGNITSSGIFVVPRMPPAMGPLNVQLQ